jgi:predicted Zn-dependent peptidase
VGNHVVGDDFLSRLMRNLREKNGFTYGVDCSFRYRRSGSTWSASAAVNTDATAAALKEMLAELDGVLDKQPLTDTEVEVGRLGLLRALPQNFETPARIAGQLEELAIFNLPLDYFVTHQERLRTLPRPAIQATTAELLDKSARVVLVVGDRGKIEPLLKAAGFSNIRAVTADGGPKG